MSEAASSNPRPGKMSQTVMWSLTTTHNQCSCASTFQPVSSMAFTRVRRAASRRACHVVSPRCARRSTARQMLLRCTDNPNPFALKAFDPLAPDLGFIPEPLILTTRVPPLVANGDDRTLQVVDDGKRMEGFGQGHRCCAPRYRTFRNLYSGIPSLERSCQKS